MLGPGAFTDSVDGDDGAIDGFGTRGHSWLYGAGSVGVKFTFAAPVTAAGIVWTDGAGTTTFSAFGVGDVFLGAIGPFAIADGGHSGTTGEDRFFGLQFEGGIESIHISNTSGGIEVDHLQFGDMPRVQQIPLPAGLPLYLGALALLGARLGRRKT